MKSSQKFTVWIMLGFFSTLVVIVVWRYTTQTTQAQLVQRSLSDQALSLFDERLKDLTASQIRTQQLHQDTLDLYEIEQQAKARARIEAVPYYMRLRRYIYTALPILLGLCGLTIAMGISVGIVRQKSVFHAHLDANTDIPVKYRDLATLAPTILGAVEVRLQQALTGTQDEVRQQVHAMLTDFACLAQAVGGRHGLTAFPAQTSPMPPEAPALVTTPAVKQYPPLAELIAHGRVMPGAPLCFGYQVETAEPIYREREAIKNLAVSGGMGSGKSYGLAYLIGMLSVQAGDDVFLFDPHRGHPKSLTARLTAFIQRGIITEVNPFEFGDWLTTWDQQLDRRLASQESSERGVTIVFDEFNLVARNLQQQQDAAQEAGHKTRIYDQMIALLARMTSEARKVKMQFIGSAVRWQAEDFGRKAAIRNCIQSTAIFRQKPEQAKLLISSTDIAHAVTSLKQPGDCVLATDYAEPVIARMPFFRDQDMAAWAEQWQPPTATPKPCVQVASVPAMSTDLLTTLKTVMRERTLTAAHVMQAAGIPGALTTFERKLAGSSRPFTPSEQQQLRQFLASVR